MPLEEFVIFPDGRGYAMPCHATWGHREGFGEEAGQEMGKPRSEPSFLEKSKAIQRKQFRTGKF